MFENPRIVATSVDEAGETPVVVATVRNEGKGGLCAVQVTAFSDAGRQRKTNIWTRDVYLKANEEQTVRVILHGCNRTQAQFLSTEALIVLPERPQPAAGSN